MKIEIEQVAYRVKELLKDNPSLRDNDKRLICNIWFADLEKLKKDIYQMTAFEFIQQFASGKLTNPESIRRSRQTLQKNFKDLRGELYSERHDRQEVIKKELVETPELFPGGTPSG